jgi:hypothetical protein
MADFFAKGNKAISGYGSPVEDSITKRETINGIHCTHWKSGYIEMCGETIPTTAQGNRINFPYEMKDTSYNLIVSEVAYGSVTLNAIPIGYGKQATGVTLAFYSSTNPNGMSISFKAEGYKKNT